MALKPLDSRQSVNRSILQELFPYIGSQTLDILLASINSDLTPPFMVDATSSPSLVVNVGPSNILNPESNRNHSASFIGSTLPNFASGTVTFPSSSGGNVTTSTGGSTPLVLAPGQYCAVLISIDQSNNLGASAGSSATSPSLVIVPSPEASTLPFAYIIVHNIGGVIQNITQSNIFQLEGGGGSGGTGGGIAQEVPLTIATTSITVTFPTPKSDTNYGLVCQMVNVTDTNPVYMPITITQKTTTGFVAKWNGPLETSNYALDYIVGPGVSETVGEFIISMGSTSATISFPIAFPDTNYVVIATMSDYTDTLPQFQPLTISNKSLSSFTISWNAPTETGFYRISWQAAAFQ